MKNTFAKIKNSRWLGRLLSPLFLLFLIVLFAILTKGRFAQARNLKILIEQGLVVATVATGATFIYATGNVNISMGASTALIATLAAQIYLATNSVLLMIVASIVMAVILMGIMASLSTMLRIRVLYVTVVMMTLLSSIQKSIVGSATISLPNDMITMMKSAYFPYVAFVVYFIFCLLLFHYTSIGRKLRVLGTNQICGEFTGFKLSKYLLIAFLISGIGVGLGAVMTIVRTASIGSDTCSTLNMDVLLALVLGGMSVFGGSRSHIYAASIGALTVTVLNNGLLMVGISNIYVQAIRGIIFIILVFFSQTRPNGLPSKEG